MLSKQLVPPRLMLRTCTANRTGCVRFIQRFLRGRFEREFRVRERGKNDHAPVRGLIPTPACSRCTNRLLRRSTVTLSVAASVCRSLATSVSRAVVKVRLLRGALVAHGRLAELCLSVADPLGFTGRPHRPNDRCRYGISSRARAEICEPNKLLDDCEIQDGRRVRD